MPEIVLAPGPLPTARPQLFLAGTIDMGNSANWQDAAAKKAVALGWTVLSPRREGAALWESNADDPTFIEQVNWELDGQDQVDRIVMNFLAKSLSPISLLELGLYAASGKLVVVCPEEFWRAGNVAIVCARYHVPLVATIEEALDPLLVTTNPNSQGPGPISATELRSAMSNFAPRLWRDYSGQLHFQYQEAIDSMAHGLAEMLENQIPHTAKPPLEDNPALAKGQSSADEIKDRPRQTSHDQPDSDWGLEHEYKPIDLTIHTKETTTGTIRGPHSLRSIISEVFSPAPKTPSAQPSAMATNTATPPAWPWKERVSSQSPNGDEWNVDAIYDGPTRVSPHWTVRWIPTGEWVIACDYEELYFYKFPSHTSAMAAAEDMDATLRSHQSPTDS